MDIRIHSNGLLINKTISDKIIQSEVTWIGISMDAATPDTYKKIRGGNFDKSCQAVENLMNSKRKYKNITQYAAFHKF